MTTCVDPLLQKKQVEIEQWLDQAGTVDALRRGWEATAGRVVAARLSHLLAEEARREFHANKERAGINYKFWSLCGSEENAVVVTLEAVNCLCGDERLEQGAMQHKVAATLGKRAEVVLFLHHPRNTRTLAEQYRRIAGRDLGMDYVVARMRKQGLEQASLYRVLTPPERVGIGLLLIHLVARVTGLVEVYKDWNDRRALVWHVKYGERWQQALMVYRKGAERFRHRNGPMVVPPLPRSRDDVADGGYLSIRTRALNCEIERFDWSVQAAQPMFDAINRLQAVPFVFSEGMRSLVMWALKENIPAAGIPPRGSFHRPRPNEYESKAEFWKAFWKYRADRRHFTTIRRLSRFLAYFGKLDELQIDRSQAQYFPWSADYRGRLYQGGGPCSYYTGQVVRACTEFKQQSPMRGHEDAFAWCFGEALGMARDQRLRSAWLQSNSQLIAAIGSDPRRLVEHWRGMKEPWHALQMARDWAAYLRDPGHTTGTIYRVDQTCSGFGHMACLVRDAQMAQLSNVTGSACSDVYEWMRPQITQNLHGIERDLEGTTEHRRKAATWWIANGFERDLLKRMLVPMLYGGVYRTLKDAAMAWIDAELNRFSFSSEVRNYDLAEAMAKATYEAVKTHLPATLGLPRWLGQCSALQMKAGYRPCWRTPSGLNVESFTRKQDRETIYLEFSGKPMTVEVWTANAEMKQCAAKNSADFIHSLEASFLHGFVNSWGGKPLITVHDCFGTTLENVATMRAELCRGFRGFYRRDYLIEHWRLVADQTGYRPPEPPMVGTLAREEIGSNLALFS
jgi:hypothetical protein